MEYRVELKVRDLLSVNGITQKQLAEISGLRESTISDIVRGTRTVINFDHLSKIAEALEIQDISQLIDFANEQSPEATQWEQDVHNCIKELRKEYFSLSDVYGFIDRLQQMHPNNHNVDAKIRQMLQVLRKKEIVEFIDNDGHYRLL